MKADKARRLTNQALKHVEITLSPYIREKIETAAMRGNRAIRLTDYNEHLIAMLNNLGYKTEVLHYRANKFWWETALIVTW